MEDGRGENARLGLPHGAARAVLLVWAVLLLAAQMRNSWMFNRGIRAQASLISSSRDSLLEEARGLEREWAARTAALTAGYTELATVATDALEAYLGELDALGVPRPDMAPLREILLHEEAAAQREDSKTQVPPSPHLETHRKGSNDVMGRMAAPGRALQSRQNVAAGVPDLLVAVAPVTPPHEVERRLAALLKALPVPKGANILREGGGGGDAAGDGPTTTATTDTDTTMKLSEDAAATQRELQSFMVSMFIQLYRVAQYRDRVVRFREVFAPFIDAVEARDDRMLYNYI